MFSVKARKILPVKLTHQATFRLKPLSVTDQSYDMLNGLGSSILTAQLQLSIIVRIVERTKT